MSLMQSLVLCSAPGLAGVTYTKALLHKVNLSAETLFPMQLSVVFKVPKHLLGVFSKKKKKEQIFTPPPQIPPQITQFVCKMLHNPCYCLVPAFS